MRRYLPIAAMLACAGCAELDKSLTSAERAIGVKDGTVVATATDSGEAFTASTDAYGRFELPLSPGTYEVTIDAASTPPTTEPQTVTVEDGSYTEIEVFVDTGIR